MLEFQADKAQLCLLPWIHREFYIFALLMLHFHTCLQLLFIAAPPGAASSVTAPDTPGVGTTMSCGCCTGSHLCHFI